MSKLDRRFTDHGSYDANTRVSRDAEGLAQRARREGRRVENLKMRKTDVGREKDVLVAMAQIVAAANKAMKVVFGKMREEEMVRGGDWDGYEEFDFEGENKD